MCDCVIIIYYKSYQAKKGSPEPFDCVLHVLLIQDLSGIPGVDWIHDFVCNRSQTVLLYRAQSISDIESAAALGNGC